MRAASRRPRRTKLSGDAKQPVWAGKTFNGHSEAEPRIISPQAHLNQAGDFVHALGLALARQRLRLQLQTRRQALQRTHRPRYTVDVLFVARAQGRTSGRV